MNFKKLIKFIVKKENNFILGGFENNAVRIITKWLLILLQNGLDNVSYVV